MSLHTTAIQWTHVPGYKGETWNPTTGCTRVSPGCDHCYAFQLHDQRHVAWKRGRFDSAPEQYHQPFSTVQLLEARLTEPLRAKKPRAYFVDSMADLFHEDVPDDYLDRVFAVMAVASQHIFMVLTKRPERMCAYLRAPEREDRVEAAGAEMGYTFRRRVSYGDWPLSNVWLGVSAEDQARADDRIPLLLDTPAAVRFVSAEPLLGPIEFSNVGGRSDAVAQLGRPALAGIDWVIVGGESGPHARPFHLAWARSIRDQCAATGVAFFMKQLGQGTLVTPRDDFPVARRGHNGDPLLWPEDLRVREWPAARVIEALP